MFARGLIIALLIFCTALIAIECRNPSARLQRVGSQKQYAEEVVADDDDDYDEGEDEDDNYEVGEEDEDEDDNGYDDEYDEYDDDFVVPTRKTPQRKYKEKSEKQESGKKAQPKRQNKKKSGDGGEEAPGRKKKEKKAKKKDGAASPRRKKEPGAPNPKKGKDPDAIAKLLASFQKLDINDGASCSLSLAMDIAKFNEPLFLTKGADEGLTLALPNLDAISPKRYDRGSSALHFKEGQPIFVACTGKDNSVVSRKPAAAKNSQNEEEQEEGSQTEQDDKDAGGEDASIAELRCAMGAVVPFLNEKTADENVNLQNVACLRPTSSQVIYSEETPKCGNGQGQGLELGFMVEGWQKLAFVCHNVAEARTLYATHTLYGTALAGKVIAEKRPPFTRGQKSFFAGMDPNKAYSQKSQSDIFDIITGNSEDILIPNKRYLARGHFAPDADFLFKSWQDSTYFYVNVAPQWQTINNGNWLVVETLARNLAMELREDLQITTGSYGIMQLRGQDGRMHDVYLQPAEEPGQIDRVPVPNYYWKLISRPKAKSCVVLVSTNNPFSEGPVVPFCKNVCSAHNWNSFTLDDKEKGAVFCCAYSDFKRVVKFAPNDVVCDSILDGPHSPKLEDIPNAAD